MGNCDKDFASQLWDRAEECRAIAERIPESHLRAEYLKLAEAYLNLATREERLRGRNATMICRGDP